MESARIRCPYCGEEVEIVFEEDLEGEMIWDCEVCCRPWRLYLDRSGDLLRVDVATSDDE
jgi:hypothetical protein